MEGEGSLKEQLSAAVSGNSASARPKLLRYSLRSSAKSKEQKPDASDRYNSSESKRGRTTPSVSKSVGVLDFSGKDKSGGAKPPRRFSIPNKASATPSPKLVGNITPISETRTRRSANSQGSQGRNQTPNSDISRATSSRIKFNLLSSASYWLNQIKLSESASKHSVSFGFFKLALEAGCEPFQRMQDELKSYVRRHKLAELEPVKELFESYKIAENQEQSQVSETTSQVPVDGTQSSDDEVHCCSSTTEATEKLKPKCFNTDSTQLTPVTTEPTKKETSQKSNTGSRLRENPRMHSVHARPAFDSGNRRPVKKPEKPSAQKLIKEKGEVKKRGKKSDAKEAPVSPSLAEDNARGDKENMEVQSADDTCLTEVVV